MRRPDNKKNEQHFQTPPMASQKKRSHDFGPLAGCFGEAAGSITLKGSTKGTYTRYVAAQPAITG